MRRPAQSNEPGKHLLDQRANPEAANLQAAIIQYTDNRMDARYLGNKLNTDKGKIAGGLCLCSKYDSHTKVNHWYVETLTKGKRGRGHMREARPRLRVPKINLRVAGDRSDPPAWASVWPALSWIYKQYPQVHAVPAIILFYKNNIVPAGSRRVMKEGRVG